MNKITKLNNIKFNILNDKLIKNLISLKSFFINRFILEIDYGTIDILIDEIILSLFKLHYFVVNSISSDKRILYEKKMLLVIKRLNKLNIIIYAVFHHNKFKHMRKHPDEIKYEKEIDKNTSECSSSESSIENIYKVGSDLLKFCDSSDKYDFINSDTDKKIKIISNDFKVELKDVSDLIIKNKYYLATNITFTLLLEKILIEISSYKKMLLIIEKSEKNKKCNNNELIVNKIKINKSKNYYLMNIGLGIILLIFFGYSIYSYYF